VILDDALAQNPFYGGCVSLSKPVESSSCLQMVKQAKLIGVLYIEKNKPSILTCSRRPPNLDWKTLALQAAIRWRTLVCYNDLQERGRPGSAAAWSTITVIGIMIGDIQARIIEANQAF